MVALSLRDPATWRLAPGAPTALAPAVYRRAMRRGLDQPGFCLIPLDPGLGSGAQRAWMVELARALSALHRAETGRSMGAAVGRYDQRETTRPHLDGGPGVAILLLGYEPSANASRLGVVDHALLAEQMGLTPAAWMAAHNPMREAADLSAVTTWVGAIDGAVLAIDNSADGLGVLHHAEVTGRGRRVVNSLLLGEGEDGDPAALLDAEVL